MRRFFRVALPVTALTVIACAPDNPAPVPFEPIAATASVADAADPTPGSISLEKIGEFDGGGEAAAEITAFDAVSQRLFVVNGALGTVDVLDMTSPASPKHLGTIDVSSIGSSANSVAADQGVVAVAIQATVKTDPGTVAFYRATTLQLISAAREYATAPKLARWYARRMADTATAGPTTDAVRALGIAADVLTSPVSKYERWQHDPGFLDWLVAREGLLLYSTGRVPRLSPQLKRVREEPREGV